VFGGTFDPIHLGHIDTAAAARDALGLTRVLLMPSRLPPHRHEAPQASTYHRFAMAALAALGADRVEASDLELQAPPPSYTADTLDRLRRQGYDALQIFFIAGADAFAEIATWHDYPSLIDRCHFAVVSRPGCPASTLPERLPELARRMLAVGTGGAASEPASPHIFLIDAPTADVSSTDVRRRAAAGAPLTGLVAAEVDAHIRRHGLYRPAARETHDD
jgi:nicotinate-nucleotide adenylyltransferase